MIIAARTANEAFETRNPGIVWIPAQSLGTRVQFILLPMASRRDFAVYNLRTYAAPATGIDRAEYLQFGIGGLIGNWAGIAIKRGRKFAGHMDSVEHELVLRIARGRT
jgi:hypothetical protein